MAITYLEPALYQNGSKKYDIPSKGTDQKITLSALDIPGFLSSDVGNLLTTGTDGKLLQTADVECTFRVADLLSEEDGNIVGLSIEDGKLFASQCVLQVSDWLSQDVNNGLGLGTDGKFWFDNTLDCEINLSNLLSTDADNAIKLSLVDGKLKAVLAEECSVNVISLLSTKTDNRIVINDTDGKLYLPPYDCQFDLIDLISSNTWNRLRVNSESGGDGKLMVLCEDQVSSIENNRLKANTDGDHKFYVRPTDLISTDASPGLKVGTDGGLVVDIASGVDASGLLVATTSGSIDLDWVGLLNKFFSAENFKLIESNVIPYGGTWAYIAFRAEYDGDLPGDEENGYNFVQSIAGVGLTAGGTVISAAAHGPVNRMIIWRVS